MICGQTAAAHYAALEALKTTTRVWLAPRQWAVDCRRVPCGHASFSALFGGGGFKPQHCTGISVPVEKRTGKGASGEPVTVPPACFSILTRQLAIPLVC